MFCSNCGEKLADSVRFCPVCGTATHNAEAGQKATAVPENVEDTVQNKVNEETNVVQSSDSVKQEMPSFQTTQPVVQTVQQKPQGGELPPMPPRYAQDKEKRKKRILLVAAIIGGIIACIVIISGVYDIMKGAGIVGQEKVELGHITLQLPNQWEKGNTADGIDITYVTKDRGSGIELVQKKEDIIEWQMGFENGLKGNSIEDSSISLTTVNGKDAYLYEYIDNNEGTYLEGKAFFFMNNESLYMIRFSGDIANETYSDEMHAILETLETKQKDTVSEITEEYKGIKYKPLNGWSGGVQKGSLVFVPLNKKGESAGAFAGITISRKEEVKTIEEEISGLEEYCNVLKYNIFLGDSNAELIVYDNPISSGIYTVKVMTMIGRERINISCVSDSEGTGIKEFLKWLQDIELTGN